MEPKLLRGREVPIFRSDGIKWVEVSVPSAYASAPGSPPLAPATQDAGSCCVIGDPPTYVVWKIDNHLPHALEVLEFHTKEEFPRVGLRIVFPEALSPFAYVFQNVNTNSHYPYLLYALSVSGVAYSFQLKSITRYAPSSFFSPDELIRFEMQNIFGSITAIAATAGCLVVGRNDGSLSCFHLGLLDPNDYGFVHELRDDATLSRLWGFVSRGRAAGSVKDVVISDVQKTKLVFVLHSDGNLRVWDLFGHAKLFSGLLSIAGTSVARMWVGELSEDSISLAVLHKQALEVNIEGIYMYVIHLEHGDRISLSLKYSEYCIPLVERELIDVKLTANMIWVLKQDGLIGQELYHLNGNIGQQFYSLHEDFVADKLFQSSKDSLDYIFQISCSIFSNEKAQMMAFFSSIFLHGLFHPGLQNTNILRATLEDYNKQWTDAEFQALSVEDLKKEILLLIEHQAVSGNTFSIFKCWVDLCTRYFTCWCMRNKPHGLLVDSLNGSIGLLRKDSLSQFRYLEDIELLVYGTFDELIGSKKTGLDISGDSLEQDTLVEVLFCCKLFRQHFGRAVASLFYQSVISVPIISPEDLVHHVLKSLESGYNSSSIESDVSELGMDLVYQKESAPCKGLRRFSIDMLVSLHGLCTKANGWVNVLNVVENYLNFLIPGKVMQNSEPERILNFTTSIVVQATCQVADVMLKCALDILLLLYYLIRISGQINMLHAEITKVQLELIPMVHEIVVEWLLIYFFGTTPAQSPAVEDFNSQLSSLQIDYITNKPSWSEKLGSIYFTLDFILWFNASKSLPDQNSQSASLPTPKNIISMVKNFTSWITWGHSGNMSSYVFCHSTELALILLRHKQYNAVETFLKVIVAHLKSKKLCESIQEMDGEWCLLLHLLGYSLVAQTQGKSSSKEKINEAVMCFFRASSGGDAGALQRLACETGPQQLDFAATGSDAVWRLHYYQWVMQLFEQYNISEGAYAFSLAALEQVDEGILPGSSDSTDFTDESASALKGRLWANVFKFSLDLSRYYDAYCAIISNPDEESKCICLRRFIIVLCERGATKILCDGELPFIGLSVKVERELACKAACADISMKPNPYKLLYAFEMQRQNWRKAASYMYLYSEKLEAEMTVRDFRNPSLALQERLNAISAAINALLLVHPTCAWIYIQIGGSLFLNESHPSKKLRIEEVEAGGSTIQSQRRQSFVDIKRLEEEYILTYAEYLLLSAKLQWFHIGNKLSPSDLIDLLVKTDLYDMAFTVILRFWKGSGLKRELELVFSTMSLKCCRSEASLLVTGSNGVLLKSSLDEPMVSGTFDASPPSKQPNTMWEVLEVYLEKYKALHPRLPLIVADTLLRSDCQIELPRWLIHMFKGGQQERTWGMTGQDCDVASLFRLYVDYGRYAEATNLLIQYFDAYASTRPANIIHRKRQFAAWFPYITIERLWCQLEESFQSGHMIQQSEKLKSILLGALRSHLHLLKRDNEDALSSAIG